MIDVYMFPESQVNNSARASTTNNQGRTRPSGHNYDCSICLGSASYAVETNCGHIFWENAYFSITK